ncbi:MAG: WG repeat-containing protein [Hungatella sp.]|jgi:hypothetical protein|nr:WG repeat-containing protein [Hungatella sp.]
MNHRKECRIYTITGKAVGGFISGSHIYPESELNLYYDFHGFYLLPIESDGKWGLMNGKTNEIVISLQFDYTETLFDDYIAGHAVKNGLHGYINAQGQTVVPFEYENAKDQPSSNGYFAVKRGKWGVVNGKNEPILPLVYDGIELDGCFDRTIRLFTYFEGISAIRDGYLALFNKYGEILVDHLTTHPQGYSRNPSIEGKYMILKRKRKFGVICRDGRLITNITMLKREAKYLIQKLEGAC